MVLTHSPPEDVVGFLSGKTVGARTLVGGTNLFASEPIVDGTVPIEAVFVWSAAGFPPVPYMGVAPSVWYPRVQVRVRGNARAVGARQEARTAARAVLGLLHRAQLAGYISCLANESEPIHLGENGSGGFEFGLNFDLIYRD